MQSLYRYSIVDDIGYIYQGKVQRHDCVTFAYVKQICKTSFDIVAFLIWKCMVGIDLCVIEV